ncbi:MAG: AMIN domain-containing protein [Terriglobales bacterium]|jgi:hypothetical protein
MQRLSYVGTLLAVAALLPTPLSAQGFAQKSAPNSARVERVVVRASGPAMEVEIQTSGATVAPDTQVIAGPDRIVVDFPGAIPSAELRALKVNRGALKGIRTGLFFDNPPITRVVLDLAEQQSYKISTTQNAIVVTLSSVKSSPAMPSSAKLSPTKLDRAAVKAPTARLQNASLAMGRPTAVANGAASAASPAVPNGMAAAPASASETAPLVAVTFENGMLRIRAERATLAQVLFEVQRQTQADIAIPAGAELEPVVADLGPAPAREVLASLLNGSPYNFIFMGDELTLERVILTRRDPSNF